MEVQVLIVGAGPTGLMLACELARRGIPHRLIERHSGPSAGSRGKGVQPRTLEILDDVGIGTEVIAGGRFGIPLLIHEGGVTKKVETCAAPRDGAAYGSTLLTPQWRVEECLRRRLEALGGEVEWDTELVGLDDLGDQVVARLRAGGRERDVAAGWLVGCDGGHSTVRRSLEVPFLGETLEHIRMWVGDVEVDGLDRDHWHMWRDDAGFLALCPLRGTDDFQLQTQIAPDETRRPSLESFQEMVLRRTRREDIRLTSADWTSSWRANVRMVDRLRIGRVLLAGDAAHVHSPAGAQGMNTGVQDAYNLGWKLAAAISSGRESLVNTYEEERLPIARWVLGISSELTRTAFSPDLRRDERTMQLDLNYCASSLSVDVDVVSAHVRAGDRAPDAIGLVGQGGRRTRLFELMQGTHTTVLTFGGDVAEVRQRLDARFYGKVRLVNVVAQDENGSDHWIDLEGSAARLYGPAGGALFVIRPDGYVGLTAKPSNLAEVTRYLELIVGMTPAAG